MATPETHFFSLPERTRRSTTQTPCDTTMPPKKAKKRSSMSIDNILDSQRDGYDSEDTAETAKEAQDDQSSESEEDKEADGGNVSDDTEVTEQRTPKKRDAKGKNKATKVPDKDDDEAEKVGDLNGFRIFHKLITLCLPISLSMIALSKTLKL